MKWFLGKRDRLAVHRLRDLEVYGNPDDTFFLQDHRCNCSRQFDTFRAAQRFANYAKVVYEIFDILADRAWNKVR